ncbi:hypothetical protein C8F04DRAFT_1306148 [Mycena alexandri]|uniref:Uncharacterized protein n=1 Tax=Mycena alexandri TaxID=1745969 RepID=A0AAD6WSC0_9AGAR|nr:hypothetical protein C8F04DRAFT_1306148 [Mycena alexandri]
MADFSGSGDLRTLFDNSVDGKLCLKPKVPAVIYVPPTVQDQFMVNLRESVLPGRMKDPLVQYTVAYDPADKEKEHYSLFYFKAGVEAEGHLFKTFNLEAKAAVINILQDQGLEAGMCQRRHSQTQTRRQLLTSCDTVGNLRYFDGLIVSHLATMSQLANNLLTITSEKVDFNVIEAKVSAQWGTWIGIDAALNLVSGQVSVFNATLGLGLASGAGIRDEAVEVKLLGCGITVGKRVGISVAGSSVEINFGRFFPV